jgi:CHASE2 domain-containing sensor protein/signal transduction histidine kinase
VRRRFFVEWLLMVLLLPPARVWLQCSSSLAQVDLTLYDWAMSARQPEPSPDILIVAIDERSLKTLGPWPWPRGVHARLLDRLAPLRPRAVLLDLFLDHPSPVAEEDRLLAEALARVPAYLPLRYVAPEDAASGEAAGFREPLGIFARSARGTGHAVMTTDADGVARRIFMYEGASGSKRPYVGWQLAKGLTDLSDTDARTQGDTELASPPPLNHARQEAFGVPFAGRAGTWPTVPYVSVLNGEVPEELLRGKLVLVGATANSIMSEGIPVAGAGPMTQLSGIEVHANAVDALRNRRTVSFADGPLLILWTAAPILLALVLLLCMARSGWAVALGLAASCLALCLFVLSRTHCWLPPTAPVLGIALAYFLWSWRRLDALFSFFSARVAALNAVPVSIFEPDPHVSRTAWDSIEAQTLALDGAIDRLSQMQALLTNGFRQLPVGLLVCTEEGIIAQSNVAARSLLVTASGASEGDPLQGRSILCVLSGCDGPEARGGGEVSPTHWSARLEGEHTTAHGKVFRIGAVPLGDVRGTTTSWMVVLRNLTSERRAERDRQQWLSFLSHDMRTPQINILGLLDLYENDAHGMNWRQLLESVRREAKRSLSLADGLVDLMQARQHAYRFAEVPAGAVVLDAMDQVWAQAESRGVALKAQLQESEDATLWADAALLTRAIVNLLCNAIRHSATGSIIELSLAAGREPGRVHVVVRDEGEGMAPEQMAELLMPSGIGPMAKAVLRSESRDTPGAADASRSRALTRSHGIGLAIVREVVERHGGVVEGFSIPGVGTTFVLNLPLHLTVDAATDEVSSPRRLARG